MKSLLVASRSHEFARTFGQAIQAVTSTRPYRVESVGFSVLEEILAIFEKLDAAELRDAVLVVDLEAEISDPWSVGRGASLGLAAQLILEYPEIFVIWYAPPTSSWALPEDTAGLSGLGLVARSLDEISEKLMHHQMGARMLFDASGIRSRLKLEVYRTAFSMAEPERGPSGYKPPSLELVHSRARQFALCADEEPSFLSFNAYAAYRFGWRVAPAASKAELMVLMRDQESGRSSVDLALLDWELRFPDDSSAEDGTSLLRTPVPELGGRSILDILNSQGVKVLLISGVEPRNVPDFQDRLINKPYEGLFALRRRFAVPSMNESSLSAEEIKRSAGHHGDGSGKALDETRSQLIGNQRHAAPFACLAVASRLLARARALAASEPRDVESWVHVALLALEAKDILGGLSKTASYEALALQQEAEVEAEASFIGVSKLAIRDRLDDLEREAQALSRRTLSRDDATPSMDPATLSALSRIVNRLRLKLIAYEHVSESEQCLRRFAQYQRKLERPTTVKHFAVLPLRAFIEEAVPQASTGLKAGLRRFRRIVAWSTRSFIDLFRRLIGMFWGYIRVGGRWYVDCVTQSGTSVARLLLWSLVIVILFGIGYWVLGWWPVLCPRTPNAEVGIPVDNLVTSIAHSALTFVQLGPGLEKIHSALSDSKVYWVILFCELCLSYLHLGLLVSVLHRQLTRRAP